MRNKQHVPRCMRVNGAHSVPTACAETGYPSLMVRVLAGGGFLRECSLQNFL